MQWGLFMKKCRKSVSFGMSKDGKKNRKGRIKVWPGEVAQCAQSLMSDSLQPHGLKPTRLLCPWDSPGKSTGMGYHALLQGIFPTQGLNPGLPHHRWILYRLSNKGSPRILEWVAYPFSRGSSWPRNWTVVSCMAGGFFTNWATLIRFFNMNKLSLAFWHSGPYFSLL